MSRPIDYWKSGEGLPHITPPGNPTPESPQWAELLQSLLFGQDVIEFGCGTGRLAPLFSKRRYVGVDICEKAIEQAKAAHHGYEFRLVDETAPIEGGFALFAHTVLLHVPDDELSATIGRFRQKHVVVSEMLGTKWRRAGNPPVFNRGIMDYEAAFRTAGYSLKRVLFAPYPHYEGEDVGVLQFHHDR